METEKTKMGAFDFFIHFGVVLTLYVLVGFLLNLLFRVINVAYPQIDAYWYSPSISFPVAALIVLFPLFLFLSRIMYKSYEEEPQRKQLGVRKWLTYLTLFVTGAIVAGDLITVIYFFLDGRDFTASFVLKALSVLTVAFVIFKYYLDDLRDRVGATKRKTWLLVSVFIVLASIILGFLVIGTPGKQRAERYDMQKISDLQNIQSQIVNYWQLKGELPPNIESLKDSLTNRTIPVDPQTNQNYTYNPLGALTFEVCANFNEERIFNPNFSEGYDFRYREDMFNENWSHTKGQDCFTRTIDTDLYPPLG